AGYLHNRPVVSPATVSREKDGMWNGRSASAQPMVCVSFRVVLDLRSLRFTYVFSLQAWSSFISRVQTTYLLTKDGIAFVLAPLVRLKISGTTEIDLCCTPDGRLAGASQRVPASARPQFIAL
ncbi:unnamed protein product, partial [Mycena citricolor]